MFTLVVVLLNLVLLGAVFGVFFTYTNSVVPGLDRVEAAHAVAAMRGMNVAILNPLFLATFVAPPLTSVAAGVLLLGDGADTSGGLFFAGALVYLLGCLAVTGRVNVPLNNALQDASSTDWARVWADFSPRWRRWNAVRTTASGISLLLCGVGMCLWHATI